MSMLNVLATILFEYPVLPVSTCISSVSYFFSCTCPVVEMYGLSFSVIHLR